MLLGIPRSGALISVVIFITGFIVPDLWAFSEYFSRYWKSIYVSEPSIHNRDYIIFDHKNNEYIHSISSYGLKEDLYLIGHWVIKNDTIICTPKVDLTLFKNQKTITEYPYEDVVTGDTLYDRLKFIAMSDTIVDVTDTTLTSGTPRIPTYQKFHLIHGEPFK